MLVGFPFRSLPQELPEACLLRVRLSRKVLHKLQSTTQLWVPEGHVSKDAVIKVRRQAPVSVP